MSDLFGSAMDRFLKQVQNTKPLEWYYAAYPVAFATVGWKFCVILTLIPVLIAGIQHRRAQALVAQMNNLRMRMGLYGDKIVNEWVENHQNSDPLIMERTMPLIYQKALSMTNTHFSKDLETIANSATNIVRMSIWILWSLAIPLFGIPIDETIWVKQESQPVINVRPPTAIIVIDRPHVSH